MSVNMESHINETLQTTKKRKNAAESKKSATTTSTKCQKLTNYFFVVPKSMNPEAVTAVDAEGKLTDGVIKKFGLNLAHLRQVKNLLQ